MGYQNDDNLDLNIEEITYNRTPANEIKLAFYMRLFFKNGEFKNRSIKGLSFYLLWVILVFGLIGLLGILAFLISLMGNQYITLQFLTFALFGFTVYLIIKNFYFPIDKLLDHRVVKAPYMMLSINEYDVEIEMHRDFKYQSTRFTRFLAECPICSGEISLQDGEKDYNLPLVGRCSESPFMHVYSFDRALLNGKLISKYVVK